MLSPIKLILLLAVIGAVYFIARKAGYLGGKSEKQNNLQGNKDGAGKESTDLVKCQKCGTFVASLEDHRCEH
ncbi:hypothetical protein [Sneathiella aquimaris]|jgi:hypothetical protein|uniref:hypothetical protein n=1 Tax=Sneathiella aquimaris TaxID=2599305 RepID=UPI00146A9761|nr:hypothetical protein [Sneathiella aquimaris]